MTDTLYRFPVSQRVRTLLSSNGFETIDLVAHAKPAQLLKIRGLARAGLREINLALEVLGYTVTWRVK